MINKIKSWSNKIFTTKRIWTNTLYEAESIWQKVYMPKGYDCTVVDVKFNILKFDYLYTFKVWKK